KTGTITYGSRLASEFIPISGVSEGRLVAAALRLSLAGETTEGKYIVILSARMCHKAGSSPLDDAEFIPFSAETRMSGLKQNGTSTMKGAVDAVELLAGSKPADLAAAAHRAV